MPTRGRRREAIGGRPADLSDGELAVYVLYTSLDPARRTWLNDGEFAEERECA